MCFPTTRSELNKEINTYLEYIKTHTRNAAECMTAEGRATIHRDIADDYDAIAKLNKKIDELIKDQENDQANFNR